MSAHSIMTLQEQIVRDEGMRLTIYQDSVGKWTIGIGRNLSDVGISKQEALIMLANDIQNAENRLEQEFPWAPGLDTVRYSVLVNMTFNMGIAGLAQFHNFLTALQNHDWNLASQEMLNSLWAKQVGPRAQRLALQIETGEWQ